MILMSNKNKKIQNESFHLFKFFVANPKKNDKIIRILKLNKEKLSDFLKFLSEKSCDAQIVREVRVLLIEINKF